MLDQDESARPAGPEPQKRHWPAAQPQPLAEETLEEVEVPWEEEGQSGQP